MKTLFNLYTAAARFAETAALCGTLTAGAMLFAAGSAYAQNPILPLPVPSVSTVPSNGDVNPYGVLWVPQNVPAGILQPGDILVSNFNNSQNLQGTGTTIIRANLAGQTSLFFQAPAGQQGMTAALGIISNGTVFVGTLPTADGTSATVQAGSMMAIDRNGHQIGFFSDAKTLDGPWGMAINDPGNGKAQMFVSNVLSGVVLRFDMTYDKDTFKVTRIVTVASGYSHRTDPAALVLGPSGLAYDAVHDILYVASSSDNAIYAVATAGTTASTVGTGQIIYQDLVHLHGPLDLTFAPNGHLLVANSDGSNVDPNQPSELVEFTIGGQFIAQYSVDPNNGGAFGLNLQNLGAGVVRVGAVDDNANLLKLWTTVVQ